MLLDFNLEFHTVNSDCNMPYNGKKVVPCGKEDMNNISCGVTNAELWSNIFANRVVDPQLRIHILVVTLWEFNLNDFNVNLTNNVIL